MGSVSDTNQETSLQTLIDATNLASISDFNFYTESTAKIPLANLTALGVTFQPLTSAIQTALTGGGGSGLYYVNTMGKQMFHFKDSSDFLASLKAPCGGVGGGQARLTQLFCDPTMLFMAAALMNIERKLDAIQETQKEILAFLEAKERANLQASLNTLDDVMHNFKYNWENEIYKANKHNLVQQINWDAEASRLLYEDQIKTQLKKRPAVLVDQDVHRMRNKIGAQFQNYRLALYLYAYSAFLEVMLLGNFDEGYLNDVKQRITDRSYDYRELYTSAYDILSGYAKSTIRAGLEKGLASVSEFAGETIAKIPLINEGQLDEALMGAGQQMNRRHQNRSTAALRNFVQTSTNVTQPFVENIQTVNAFYNKPTIYLIDKENVYIQQIGG